MHGEVSSVTAVAAAIPGPRGKEALRFLGFGSSGGMLEYFAETARCYGPIAQLRVLGQTIVLLDDADLIAEVLQNQQHLFTRDTGAALLREITGDGVLTLDDPHHLQRRRLLQPAFHRAQIAHYTEHMVTLSERAASEWCEGAELDLSAAMMRLTLAIVGASLFGGEVTKAEEIAAVVSAIGRRGGRLQPVVAALAPLMLGVRRHLPQNLRLVFGRERATLERIVDPIVAQRRRRAGDELDLLAMLLAARDEGGGSLSDIDIRNELITFVLAGHETTSSALTWAWYLLGHHPEIETCFHRELDDVLGDRAPTIDDVGRLRYTANVFAEALRLYPPAAAFARRPTQRVTLGEYSVPRHASVFMSPYVTHRNARYFNDPLAFRPERWNGTPPPKFAFFPFGGGAKMCIGEAFARAEGVLVLATIGRRWRMRIAAGEITPAPSALLRPSRPVVVRIESRRVRLAEAK
jgi:cytochrome P450